MQVWTRDTGQGTQDLTKDIGKGHWKTKGGICQNSETVRLSLPARVSLMVQTKNLAKNLNSFLLFRYQESGIKYQENKRWGLVKFR